MRIRKRKVPLPLSLLSPVPLSDPYLFSRSPVQNTTHDNNTTTTTTTLSSSSSPLMLSSSDHLSTTKRSAADPRRSGPLVDNDSTSKLASATNTTVDATGFEVVDNSGLQINNNEDNIRVVEEATMSDQDVTEVKGRLAKLFSELDEINAQEKIRLKEMDKMTALHTAKLEEARVLTGRLHQLRKQRIARLEREIHAIRSLPGYAVGNEQADEDEDDEDEDYDDEDVEDYDAEDDENEEDPEDEDEDYDDEDVEDYDAEDDENEEDPEDEVDEDEDAAEDEDKDD